MIILTIVTLYLVTGATLYHHSVFKRGKGASLRYAVRKAGLPTILPLLWLTAPGYILAWGLGEKLRERFGDWWFDKVS